MESEIVQKPIKLVSEPIGLEIPRAKTVFLNYSLPPWYTPSGLYERFCQKILRADSRIARVVTDRSDRGAYDHMEILYFGEHSDEGIFGGKLDETFMHSRGGRSIRTRTEMAAELNYKYGKYAADLNSGKVKFLSLGSGAAREIITPLKRLKEDGINYANAVCVDLNPIANEYSSKLAEEAGVRDNITYKQNDILDVRRFPDESEYPEKFDIVNSIGMCEYFTPENNKIWFEYHVKERIKPEGYFITTNMRKHDPLIMWAMGVTGWRLAYKEPDEFSQIVKDSGLDIVEELFEPDTELHRFIVAQKLN